MSKRARVCLGLVALQVALAGAASTQDKGSTGQKAAQPPVSAKPGGVPRSPAKDAKRLKVFTLKDGRKITGAQMGSSGDQTFIKTADGLRETVLTADIKSVQDVPPDVTAASNAKVPGKAGSDAAAKEAEQKAFTAFEQSAAERIPRPTDRGKYLQATKLKSEAILERASELLERYPKSPRLGRVRLRKAEAMLRLSYLLNDPDRRAAAMHELQDLAKQGVSADLASRAHLALGYALMSAYDPAKAARQAEQAALKATDPDVAARALYFLGGIHHGAGRTQHAARAYDTLARAHPDTEIERRAAGKLRMFRIKGRALTDLKFTGLDGREVDIAAHRGKVVLVHFWATWCGPCLTEIPNLTKLYAALQPKGFEIIGISLDEDPDTLKRCLNDLQIKWPQCFDGKGWRSDMALRYGVSSIPASFLVDRQGNVRDTDLRGSQLEQAVKLLLAEQGAPSATAR